ncbi:DUF805 domain-containing protein [Vagococcus vulneris]|uniref:DUF805 domain-containing protein n=1 Tax=Vagococcus vulneris TaxID=1977869 RepID=A0A429ZWH4_9ENTE|nr:DUF805 domain-containing protein [Vagococcus vulneris]RST98148.1 hypothetical protein CBF37_08940 [Vagococcus vulneris]
MKKIEETGKVSFGKAIKDFWSGYLDFRGTTTRSGYWWAQLFLGIIYICLFFLMMLSGVLLAFNSAVGIFFVTMLMFLFSIAIIIPSLTLSVRRMRDSGIRSKSIFTLYLVYGALTYTVVTNVYATMLSGIVANIGYTGHGGPDLSALPSMFGGLYLPVSLTFITMLVSFFISLTAFMPTGFFATSSDNKILRAIFKQKEVKNVSDDKQFAKEGPQAAELDKINEEATINQADHEKKNLD